MLYVSKTLCMIYSTKIISISTKHILWAYTVRPIHSYAHRNASKIARSVPFITCFLHVLPRIISSLLYKIRNVVSLFRIRGIEKNI